MTRDEIVHWARVVGIATVLPAPDGQVETLERFARLAAAAEREQCARIAEVAEPYRSADLIRARGKA